ncbi:hypothetical protein BX616_007533, partial [Lobosporangium transversale]
IKGERWKKHTATEVPVTPKAATSKQQEELTIIDETSFMCRPKDDYLLEIFNVMKTNKKSLVQLLLDIFNSDDQNIKRSVQSFYKNKGPAYIVKVWGLRLKFERPYNEYGDFSRAVANIVVEGAIDELEQLTLTDDLRLPANNLSPTV